MAIVTGLVGFGDIGDIFPVNWPTTLRKAERSKTIRDFTKGVYKLALLHEGTVAIVHHSDISPCKVDQYLRRCDFEKLRLSDNYLNKYHWMDFKNCAIVKNNLESKKFFQTAMKRFRNKLRNVCFFINVADINENLRFKGYEIVKEDGLIVGFAFDIRREGEWNYGCILQDSRSKKCFAFVLQDRYSMHVKNKPFVAAPEYSEDKFCVPFKKFR